MRRALLQGLECLQELQNKYEDGPLPSSSAAAATGNGAFANGNGITNGHMFATTSFGGSFGPTSTPLTAEMEDITQSGRQRR